LAAQAGCTPAQLSLAWVLSRGPHVVPIPGTTSLAHLEENLAARDIAVSPDLLAEIDALITPESVSGARYTPATLGETDTEEFDAAG
jgi:aryl-alcohol dehydrogenase-like predicted oxidoreductase